MAKITVVLVQGIFLCVLFYNFKLQKDLIAIEKEIVANEQQLSTQAKEEKLITTLLVQTSNYKKLKEERITVSDKINLIYNGIPNDIKLASLTLNNSNDIDIDVQAKEVLSISLLINKYLESETIDHITIKSARLSTRDNSFSAELLIDFK